MDFRRLILLSIFIFSLLLLWNAWQAHNNPKLPQTTSATSQPQTGDTTPVPVPTAKEQTTSAEVAPPTTVAAATVPTGETATIQTDLVTARVSARGGDLVELILHNHNARSKENERFALFGEEHHYKAQSGFTGDAGLALPNHNTMFTIVPGKRSLEEGDQTIDLRLEASGPEGIKVTKIYTFTRGSYLINVTHEIENGSGQTLSPKLYFQLRRDGNDPAGGNSMTSTFTGPAIFTQEGKYQKIAFSDISKGKASFVSSANDGWIGMVQHFFVSAWVPAPEVPREFNVRKLNGSENPLFDAYVITPTAQVAPGAKITQSTPLFAGPQIQSVLRQLARPVSEGGIGAEGLPLVVDYGWLTILASPIFWLLQTINKFIGNWGWSIVILTICIKAVFFPLSAASYKSMARMRTLTPKLTAMRERFGSDKQRLNMEMMSLYKTEKINPLGGCLPILIQIPVFIALYWVLLGAVEMRGAPWIGWIQDLSAQDPYYILPVIMMATMFVQTKLNPTPPDPIQAKVMMIMPFAFGVMFFFFPAGLVLYWIVNNVLSIAQQWQITRIIERGAKAANDEKA